MNIYEYDQVDPLDVLHLNLMCLDFALTAELVAMIRQRDPRSFPFFGVYAREEGMVAGQVGVFRLPVLSTRGADEVGGVWAVSTHPAYQRQGIATCLLDEAHARMRSAGLQFSTLGTDRSRVAYTLYKKLGYEDVFTFPNVIIRRASLPEQTSLRAEPADLPGMGVADQLFEQIARCHLGFARRHAPFFSFLHERGYLPAQSLWLLSDRDGPVGYAVANNTRSVLKINNLLLFEWVDPVLAVTALAHQCEAAYTRVRVDYLRDTVRYVRAGFRLAERDWGVFMVKPLTPQVTIDDFRSLYGVDTDRFLISYIDVT